MVARELRSGRLTRLWLADDPPAVPPYPTGSDTLFVAYYASAELGCHLALVWPMPERVLDLYTEELQRYRKALADWKARHPDAAP